MSAPAAPPHEPPAHEGSGRFEQTIGGPVWRWGLRVLRRLRPGAPPVLQSNLPDLIQVFAAFTRMDGVIEEDEVDSILGFLRYDYPESVYGELRRLYLDALRDPRDLDQMAGALATRLSLEEKILLGIQLFVLVSRAEVRKTALGTFHRFMTGLGVAAEAIELVYQLNIGREQAAEPELEGMGSPLEMLRFGGTAACDVSFPSLSPDDQMAAFRLGGVLLLKNTGTGTMVARGRDIAPGEFSRLYEGHHVVLGDVMLNWHDLHSYFNAGKNLPLNTLFLAIGRDKQITVERKASKQSALEVRFGLDVRVTALRASGASLRGVALEQGVTVTASTRDKLLLADGTEIPLGDLKRRAREMGGRFELTPGRAEYLVSNNPDLLRPGDLLVAPITAGDLLLRIHCDDEGRGGKLEVLQAPRPILVDGQPAYTGMPLADGVAITLADGHFLRCHFADRILEEERALIHHLEARDLFHAFTRRESALDAVSFEARRGEMICVMGPSGCGKSTLLRILAGQLPPARGTVALNGIDLYEAPDSLRPFLSFMPHEEGFDPLLTVEENLLTAAAVRAPHIDKDDRIRRVQAKMAELGLKERASRLPGGEHSKVLSHGERKRLNIGMDVIGISDVYLFDEPTSGLSSKDSEHVLEIIRGMAHNKIIIVSIHQPSARLLNFFHKALLLDHGGRLAFFGTPDEMFGYFDQAYREEKVRLPRLPRPDTVPASERRQPEFIFDVLETPLLDPAGEVIQEEDHRGRRRPARRFPPSYWRDRFQAHRLLGELRRPVILGGENEHAHTAVPAPPETGLGEEWLQWTTHLKRSFLAKIRNRANLITTLVEAPALAVLVSLVMRYSEDGPYTFGTAFHIPTYLFLSLVVAMFLGLTNSADEVIRDRALLRRERNHHPRHTFYVGAKVLSLGFFSAAQCLLYLIIGNSILGITDMLHWHFIWMFLANLTGVVTGLFISAVARDAKTALNIIPLVLIPQIILGGALIKYEEMNRDLDFLSSFTRWRQAGEDPPSRLEVPVICEIMPLRWAYEGLALSQARLNPLSRTLDRIDAETNILKEIPPGEASDEQEDRLDLLKEARIPLVMMAGPDAKTVSRQVREFAREFENGTLDPTAYHAGRIPLDWVRARDVFWNEKTRLLYEKAEIERTDKRRATMPNVFFGAVKTYGGREWDTLHINALVLGGFILVGSAACVLRIRRLVDGA